MWCLSWVLSTFYLRVLRLPMGEVCCKRTRHYPVSTGFPFSMVFEASDSKKTASTFCNKRTAHPNVNVKFIHKVTQRKIHFFKSMKKCPVILTSPQMSASAMASKLSAWCLFSFGKHELEWLSESEGTLNPTLSQWFVPLWSLIRTDPVKITSLSRCDFASALEAPHHVARKTVSHHQTALGHQKDNRQF